MQGKNGRSVGADLVPQELLKLLVQSEDGLAGLTKFYNQVFLSRCPPTKWQTSVMTPLAKVPRPTQAKELRPLMLTSHIYKTYSRILITRLAGFLVPSRPEQCCTAGRESADMLFAVQNVRQLCAEWR